MTLPRMRRATCLCTWDAMRLTMLSKERVVQCKKLDDGCKEGLNVMIKTVASKMCPIIGPIIRQDLSSLRSEEGINAG